jgi:hypothetical protein
MILNLFSCLVGIVCQLMREEKARKKSKWSQYGHHTVRCGDHNYLRIYLLSKTENVQKLSEHLLVSPRILLTDLWNRYPEITIKLESWLEGFIGTPSKQKLPELCPTCKSQYLPLFVKHKTFKDHFRSMSKRFSTDLFNHNVEISNYFLPKIYTTKNKTDYKKHRNKLCGVYISNLIKHSLIDSCRHL